MSGVMERTLALLERLAKDVGGVPLATLADELNIPRSATHRLLTDLAERGYVRQLRERGDYVLTTKLVSMGLTYLKDTGIIDLTQPLLDRLAESSGELVRLAVVDVNHLTWVALSQGATSGLRYDPFHGTDARLSCTSAGHAWLSTLHDDDAIEVLSKEGLGKRSDHGPNAPTSITAVMRLVRQARKQGYAIVEESFERGLNAISVPVHHERRGVVGILALSGPSVRVTRAKMEAYLPELRATARSIALASVASPLFNRAYVRT